MNNSDKINQLVSKYQQASRDNNLNQCQEYINEIYKFIDPEALKSLKCYYKFIADLDTRECLHDEFWVYFMENIGSYDVGRDKINSFVYISVKHAAFQFFSKLYGMTPYYNKIFNLYKKAINKYENETPLTAQQLIIITGIPFEKIAACQQADAIFNAESYEKIIENSGIYPEDTFLDSYWNWFYLRNNPEYIYGKNEETERFNQILENSLTGEELKALKYLLCPENSSKHKASYREIDMKTHTNVPRVKGYVSKATIKLLSNHELLRRHPELLHMYTQTAKDNVVPDDEFIETLYQLK